MSLWEFTAVVGGYAKANTAEDDGISSEELGTLAAFIDAPAVWV